ncbi:hypothetical protein C2869_21625 [Saccharobesus litoralis]|uniref:Uncharacterized protein n=2 Tax=Saccharobesus litoralis TaxID=2172099 RepID=A0A2S0VXJ9_9ALTE|nr:hypothetical protein C2869_21625 [Saccharobesus litoralis]
MVTFPVALTANAMTQDIQHYLKIGFNAHVAKPIDHDSFVETISQYCPQANSQADENDDDDSLFSMDNAAFRQLVKEYVESLPCEIEMLKHAKSAHDWQKLAKVSHSIKGSAGNFGFKKVSEIAGELEQLLKAQRYGEVDTVFSQLIEQLNDALYSGERI